MWIAARYLQGLSLLIALLFIRRRVAVRGMLLAYGVATTALLVSIFARVFPVCYIEGTGLTAFKKISEYIIVGLLLAASVGLWRARRQFDPTMARLLIAANVLTICAELAFTTYFSVYGATNLLGHLCKVGAFSLWCVVIVQAGVTRPAALFFGHLHASEQRYRALFENMQAGLTHCKLLYDDEGRPVDLVCLEVNHAFERLMRLTNTKDALVSQIMPGIHGAHPELLDRFSRIAATGRPERFELTFGAPARHFSIAAYRSERDCLVAIFDDITERKDAERALRESEENFRYMAENAPEGIVIATVDGRHIYGNRQALNLLGYTSEELLRTTLRDLASPNALLLLQQRLADRIAGRPLPASYETVIRRKDGAGFPAEIAGVRTLWHGQISDMVFFRDITERKQAEQRAFELALERERMAILTKFIRDASHEFRTPLTIMQTNLYLLERLEDGPKRGRKLAQIGEQVTGITRLVDLLAEIARLDSGVPFAIAPTDVNKCISAEADKVQSAAAAKNVTLHLELAPDLPPILADGNRLSRALHELLDNAVRFTPAGGRVTVRTGLALGDWRLANSDVASDGANLQSSIANPQWVTVEVQDSGPGIPPDVQPRIFERFYRQDVAHTTPGFGLGLPVARAIIERHGGRLEIESLPAAGGSVFRIRLPRNE